MLILLASRADASFIAWPVAALVVLAPITSGGVCGYLARRHDLMAVSLVAAVAVCVVIALSAAGDLVGIPRDHVGASIEIVGVIVFFVPLVVFGGALGGKLRSSRYA